ncbi:hypothetical protein CAPTEDRAFT_213739 [Capitella teleta]|uniref:Uncharacterized protein n=1 Tax=Capitella teleta TaxID=283909 RepID=R7TQX2_CAPTE|nr:hypothetical protein CAPTEDRAFT_213739 [Capitella teleta]|eukprot:ELT93435.1 hypothetical protein CAPTEDRAFT_213739 [Capitella teleta]
MSTTEQVGVFILSELCLKVGHQNATHGVGSFHSGVGTVFISSILPSSIYNAPDSFPVGSKDSKASFYCNVFQQCSSQFNYPPHKFQAVPVGVCQNLWLQIICKKEDKTTADDINNYVN